MTKDQIAAFVQDLVDIGCDPQAIGPGYVIGEDHDEGEEQDKMRLALRRMSDLYGERDHLLTEISDYLRSIGRDGRGAQAFAEAWIKTHGPE